MTRQLISAAATLSIEVIDHIIVGNGRYTSMLRKTYYNAQLERMKDQGRVANVSIKE